MSPRVKATLHLLRKVTKEHRALGPDDITPVLAAGVSRQGVVDALMVAYAFNIITRMADALGFDVPTDPGAFEASARRILANGYK